MQILFRAFVTAPREKCHDCHAQSSSLFTNRIKHFSCSKNFQILPQAILYCNSGFFYSIKVSTCCRRRKDCSMLLRVGMETLGDYISMFAPSRC